MASGRRRATGSRRATSARHATTAPSNDNQFELRLGVVTFGELFARYSSQIAARLARWRNVESRFRLYLLPLFGNLVEHQLTRFEVDRVLSTLTHLSPASINHLRGDGARLIRLAEVDGLWGPHNPFALVRRWRVTRKRVNTLSAEEAAALLELGILTQEYRPLFAMAIYLGARKGELFAMRPEDVDLRKMLVSILRSHDRPTPKNGRPREHIPIPDELAPYLQDALSRADGSEWLFPGPDGQRRRENTKLEVILRRALGRAGIVRGYRLVCRRKGCGHVEQSGAAERKKCPRCAFALWAQPNPRHLRFHDLRATCITLHTESGANPRAVQEMVGHVPRDVTGLHYIGALSTDFLRRELNKLSLVGRSRLPSDTLVREPERPSMSRAGTSSLPCEWKQAQGSSEAQVSDQIETVRLLTAREVARVLGIRPESVYRAAHLYGLRVVRFGARVRFRSDDLHKLLNPTKEKKR